MREPDTETAVPAETQDALTSLLVLLVLAQAGDWPALAAALPRPAAPERVVPLQKPTPPLPDGRPQT
ncbi:MAG: hypothetical protein LDL11_01445 [Desulfarculus sp.]|nr:hypothetical protein [Desulfarculus sp.]